MNVANTPLIKHPETGTVKSLWNFNIFRIAKAFRALAVPELETGRNLLARYELKPTMENYSAVIFYENWIAATYSERKLAADNIGLSHEEFLQIRRDNNQMLSDAGVFASSFEEEVLSLPENELDQIQTGSSVIAEHMDIARTAKTRRAKENLKKSHNHKKATQGL